MLLEKYRPRKSREMVGNATQVWQIRKWLQRGGTLYVHGPTGVGKTLAVELIAREAGYELLRCGADEKRNLDYIKNFLSASGQQSLLFKKKLILVDDFDIIESRKGITELIKNSRCPVVLISNEYNLPAQLRRYCSIVKFTKPRPGEIYKFLERVCMQEKINADKTFLTKLSRSGDVRASLIDLAFAGGHRDSEDDIFAALRILFKATSIENVPLRDDLIVWIEENIPEEYQSSEEIANAYDYLSKADLHAARIIKRQSWNLQKYSMKLALYGVAMSKNQQNKKFVRYNRPRFYPNNRHTLERIAEKTHTSKRKARDYVPLVKALSDIGIDVIN